MCNRGVSLIFQKEVPVETEEKPVEDDGKVKGQPVVTKEIEFEVLDGSAAKE